MIRIERKQAAADIKLETNSNGLPLNSKIKCALTQKVPFFTLYCGKKKLVF